LPVVASNGRLPVVAFQWSPGALMACAYPRRRWRWHMTSLTVWRFEDPDRAAKALETLRGLQARELIRVMDAAVISWPEDRQAPRVRQALSLVGAGALGGTFWGTLIGLIFLVPLLGAAVGAAAGAIGGALSDIGIDDDFIASMR